jgi:endonuclease IV
VTRKHFVRVAQILSNVKDHDAWIDLVLDFASMFAEDNENFDQDRFLKFAEAERALTQEAK